MTDDEELEWVTLDEAAQRSGQKRRTISFWGPEKPEEKRKFRCRQEETGRKCWFVVWQDVEAWAEGRPAEKEVLTIPAEVMERLDDLQVMLREESNEKTALQRVEPELRKQIDELKAGREIEREEWKKESDRLRNELTQARAMVDGYLQSAFLSLNAGSAVVVGKKSRRSLRNVFRRKGYVRNSSTISGG